MSRQKKRTYLVLMAIGAAALAVDRFVLPTPVTEPGTAVALSTTTPAATVDHSDTESAPALSIPELPFPRELKPLDQTAVVRDLFAPPSSALHPNTDGAPTDKDASMTGNGDRTGEATGAAFLTQHRLTGVLIRKGLKIAVVDDAWVRIGQELDGCKLVALTGNEATFACPDQDVVLKVVEPEAAFQD